MYAIQSESTIYSWLNVKELLAWNRRDIWSINDCNGVRTYNHLVRKRTLNHLAKLAKWLSCVVGTYLYSAFDPLQSLKLQISRLFRARVLWHSGNYRVWIHSDMRTWHDKNIQSNATYSQQSSIIWPVWLNCWVFVYELSGCGFKARCIHF